MGRYAHRYKSLLIASLCWLWAAPPTHAQVPVLEPFDHKLRYDVYWNGLPLGRIRMEGREDAFGYQLSVDTKTRGIVRLFDETKSLITARGRIDRDTGAYVPQRYDSVSRNDKETKSTAIRYDAEGLIKTRKRVPPDDPANRPPVPLEEANEGLNPLTAMLQLRHALRDNIAINERTTVLRSYDGARLADFTFKVVSRASLEVLGEHRNAINVVMTRTPIAGYKQKELKKIAEGEPVVHVFFSADAAFIPLEATIKLRFGMIELKLTEQQ